MLVLATVTLVLGGLGGLPYYHPDALFGNAATVLRSGGNPHFFRYPGLVIYLDAAVYGATAAAMRLTGATAAAAQMTSWPAPNESSLPPPAGFLIPGLLVNLLFAVGGVLVTYLLALRLTGRRWPAVFAGALLATSLLWVANAHYLTVDIPLATLCALSVLLALSAVDGEGRPGVGRLIGLGIVTGLAASAKYNGALVLPVVVAALAVARRGRSVEFLRAAVLVAAAAAAAFALTNPFIFSNGRAFLADLSFEWGHARAGHTGYETTNGWWYHLSNSLGNGLGLPTLVLAAVGIAAATAGRRLGRAAVVLVIGFPLLWFVAIGASRLAFDRYMLPMLPFLVILAAYGLALGVELIRRPRLRVAVAAVLALVIITPGILNSTRHDAILGRTDTRAQLGAVLARLDGGTLRVMSGHYLMSVVSSNAPRLVWLSDVDRSGDAADIIVFDSYSHDRWAQSGGRWRPPQTGRASERWSGISISPYRVARENVAYSPQSLYSPYLPDLWARERPGPYIELLSRDAAVARAIRDACASAGVPVRGVPGDSSFYLARSAR